MFLLEMERVRLAIFDPISHRNSLLHLLSTTSQQASLPPSFSGFLGIDSGVSSGMRRAEREPGGRFVWVVVPPKTKT